MSEERFDAPGPYPDKFHNPSMTKNIKDLAREIRDHHQTAEKCKALHREIAALKEENKRLERELNIAIDAIQKTAHEGDAQAAKADEWRKLVEEAAIDPDGDRPPCWCDDSIIVPEGERCWACRARAKLKEK